MRLVTTTALALLLSSGLAFAQADPAAPDAASQDGGAQPSASGDAQNGDQGGSATASADVLVPLDNDEAPVPSLNLMVDQVEDMQIIGADDGEIGEVGEVLGGADGQAKAITASVGGFLGLGEKTVIIMLDDVELDMGRLRTALTRSEIEDLPDFSG